MRTFSPNRFSAVAMLLLTLTASCWAQVANNPGIGISGGISGQEGLCTGNTATYTATLDWPSGVSHPVPGKYTWSATPTGIISIDGSPGPVTNASSLDVDLVTVGGLKKGQATLTVQWKADSGNYSMPSASKKVCVVDPIPTPTAATAVTYTIGSTDPAPDFGVTIPTPNVIDITPYIDCSNMVWKLKVTSATDHIPMGVNMNGRQEASAAAATKDNWKAMIADIEPARKRTIWWSTNAIWAHENAHLADWKQVNGQSFITFQVTVEALTIPFACDTAESQAQAKLKFLALPSYQAAIDLMWDSAWNAVPKHPAADAETFAAERGVLDPIITAIQIKAAQNGWP